MKKFFDKSMYRFLIVGCMNTILGLALIYLFYNIFHFGYWGSTAPAYVIASVFSYVMNKVYTFSYKKKDKMSMLRFVIVQVLAYVIAYLIARPLTFTVLECFRESTNLDIRIVEQIAIVVGMGFFVVLGYLGQRFFVFRQKQTDNEDNNVLLAEIKNDGINGDETSHSELSQDIGQN